MTRPARRAWLRNCSLGLASAWLASAHAAQSQGPRHTVLVVGDSLSAEYGLARGTGWVTLLERRLAEQSSAHAS